MKVVITRDRNGFMEFWPIGISKALYRNDDGEWWHRGHQSPTFEFEDDCGQFKSACELLQFTPRKGRKYIVDIPAAKILKK